MSQGVIVGAHQDARLDDVLDRQREPTIASITTLVSKKLKVRAADLRGNTRRHSIVQARSLAMYLGRELTAASLQQIGKYFGGRDHSTVLHALKRASEAVKNEPEIARLARELTDQLRAG
jgi:chromosomal replication initiator protein